MTQNQLFDALAGKEDDLTIKAVLVLVDSCIEEARLDAERPGLAIVERSEACGGASFLRGFKKELQKWTAPIPPEK